MSTRTTGILMMVAVCATLIAGILPLPPRAEAQDLRLALFGCSLLCVLMWMTVPVRARSASTRPCGRRAAPPAACPSSSRS
ncbi:hypothetical protein OG596_32415 [Streptomyces sp. NBC_01102]|uniref:hypothetical protein n=1 Tax=Streptomyces sp. NBC_01102 TaxID=2903749 RepID=UPI003862F375|nr:hypothetical protein OG596_32415 [Streptomyces sp. NBC_01102]